MTDDAMKKMTPDERKATAARLIEQDLRHSEPVETPRAIMTGGQPGSGKNHIVESVGVQFEGAGGVIVIDPNEIRLKLPYMQDLIASGSLDMPDAAYIDAAMIAHEMVQVARQERRNIIVDSTLANTRRALELAEGFRKAAYHVELHAMAVSPELSHARLYSRREDQVAMSPTGCHSSPELRRFQMEHDLPNLHRERWNRITAELTDQIEAAAGDDRARLQHQLDRHYADRFDSETSRKALLAEAGIVVEK